MRRASPPLLLATLVLLVGLSAGRGLGAVAQEPAGSPEATPIAAGSIDWPMYKGNPARTGEMAGSGPAGQPVEPWRVQLGGPAYRSPAVAGGVVYRGIIDASDVAAYLTWSATQSPNPIEVLAPEVRFDGCGEDYDASFQPVLGQDNNQPDEQDTKPVKGAVFFDESYNTCLVRATDHANEPPVDFARNDYSRRQAFNADSSRFVTIAHDGSWHLYDGVTLAYLNVLRGPAGDAEIQWHPTAPNLLFYLPNAGGMVLYQYDIRDDSSTIVGDFGRADRDVPLPWPTAARVWTKSEGSPSADGRYWGFQVETGDFEPLGLMVWDRQTDEILGTWDFAEHGVGRPDHVSMSPSGEYIVPSWDGNAYGTTAFSRDFTQQVTLHHKSEHSDLALLPNGHDAYVSVDYQSNAGDVFMVEIQTGQKTVLFPTYLDGTATALHVSGKAFNRPGWVLMSTYSTEPATHWLHTKLFAVELNADPTIVNLAHTHVVANGYWSEPHASVNRDFTRVIFNSNWDTGSDVDVDAYLVVLPNRVFQESGGVVNKFDAIPTRYLVIGNSLSLSGSTPSTSPSSTAMSRWRSTASPTSQTSAACRR